MREDNRSHRKMALLTVVGLAVLSPVVHAGVLTNGAGNLFDDLILGFRADGAPGQTLNLEVDLGEMSQFYVAPGSTIPLPGLSVQDRSEERRVGKERRSR